MERKRMNLKKLENMARSTGQGRKKKPDCVQNRVGAADSNLPWVERNFPVDLDELFVHKKKVDEVRQWITTALNARNTSRNQPKICVLSGPCGSGKTATVGVLAKEQQFEVKEWINPMNLIEFNSEATFQGDELHGRSQTDLFSDFLLRSSQYSALPLKGALVNLKRVVVVEDFPNAFFRDPPVFHNLLRNYQTHGAVPLIFIVPDGGQLNHTKLFPKSLVEELRIHSISFNAVAPTLMKKFLNAVCQRENTSVPPSTIEAISIGSNGDVRCAINMLQFRICQESGKDQGFKRPFPVTRKGGKGSKCDDLLRQDDSLMLFHALGKALYNKRDRTTKSEIEHELIEELAEERRIHPPESDPDQFLGKIDVSIETFVNFLHQNYPPFFGDIETCTKASSYLSDAEVVLSRWVYGDNTGSSFQNYKTQDTREQVAVNVAVRGVMHSNTAVRSNQYRPLRKPLYGDLRTKVQKSEEQYRNAFDSQPILSSCFTEDVPLLARIPGNYLNSDQKSVVQALGLFKGGRPVPSREFGRNSRIGEQTQLESYDEDEDENTTGVQVGGPLHAEVKIARLESCDAADPVSAEDFLIEEFED